MACPSCSTSECTCGTNAVELDFSAPILDMRRGIRLNRTYQFRIVFKYPPGSSLAGQPYDIASDGFEMSIRDVSNVEVENLQVGSGFTIIAPNILVGVITPATTGTVGRYMHTITWTITANGATPIAAEGTIIVKP